ncbi:MAG TPA: hypothetical protein PLL09_11495 [Flavobacterium sp.]|uniref:hypothetical protein n=1 Tax=unclassified Flavobacterium TaxID=196869 RepID=UPI0025BA85F6|nr:MULTISPECIES: hypothetical protein [unclassified Flavobacterium]HRE78433.1 hypothetical protein [Flavobacterium sp.]
MHEPYEKRLGHKADFRVKYKFRSPEDGGRKTGEPYQGIRCDFSFVGETENKMYMIWPEFEDREGNVLLCNDKSVPNQGTARMWIINNEMRPLHYDKIKIGVKGNFREGAMFSADCEVIEVLDLKINPTKNK